jgi:hypothetical protein
VIRLQKVSKVFYVGTGSLDLTTKKNANQDQITPTMADPFASLEINPYDRPVYCRQVKAFLLPGNWVIFKNEVVTKFKNYEESEDNSCIGLIMGTSPTDENTLQVNLFRRVTPALIKELRLRCFVNPLYKWIPQILRTPRCQWIDAGSVESIAWVFQTQHFDSKPNEGHQGMSNLFLLHYNELGQLQSSGDCYPFCSYYAPYKFLLADCYQERVWNGLQSLRSEICRHLGRYSEKQGSFTRVSSQVIVGREAWNFLLSKVESEIGMPIGRNSCMSRRVLEPGLVLRSSKNGFYSTMIRFETEGQLRSLSSVLGELVTMEVRKRRPKYNVMESLKVNDVVNIISGSEEREVPFRHRTNKQGIDFVYDGSNRVRIRLRYERYQYKLPLLTPSILLTRAIERKTPLAPGDSESSSDEEDSSDDDGRGHSATVEQATASTTARIGREFEFSARLYRVQSIDLQGLLVSAKVVWPLRMNEQVHSFTLADVETWIARQS